MATQSEDIIPRVQSSVDVDSESEDEATADYPNFPTTIPGIPALGPFNLPSRPEDVPAYLASLPTSFKSTGSALPKRGLKDFEPHPTQLQASTLETSRQSMNNALQHMRVHGPKTRVVGIFDERTGMTTVKQRRGNWLGNVGRDLPGGGVELRREEALWAVERGSLDCHFRNGAFVPQSEGLLSPGHEHPVQAERRSREDEVTDQNAQDNEVEDGLPMSLQAAYATLVDDCHRAPGGRLNMEDYVVYSGLKRSGFIVLRAKDTGRWRTAPKEMDEVDGRWIPNDAASQNLSTGFGIFSRLFGPVITGIRHVLAERSHSQSGTILRPGLFRSYQDIFRLLAKSCPAHIAPVAVDQARPKAQGSTAYTTTWHVYKPIATRPFRKKDPGRPDFCICVVNARETRVPTLVELESLMNEQTLDLPVGSTFEQKSKRGIGQTYAALKHGHRHVILAVVDEGIVSYMRLADAVFAQEGRLFEREGFASVGGPGGKKGGGGGGGRKGRHRAKRR